MRGNSKIFCNQFPAYKTKRTKWNAAPLLNIHDVLLNKVMVITGKSDREAADALIYYVYAVMSSNEYLKQFGNVLFTTADPDNPPRIPIAQDYERFTAIVRKGQDLAELEKPQQESSASSFLHFADIFKAPFKLTYFSLDGDAGKIELFQDSELQLEIEPVPKPILDHEVGGYRVIQQWLKLYTYPFLNSDFTSVHFKHLLILLSQIEGQIALIKELDPLVSPLLDGKAEIFSAKESDD